MSIAEDTWTLTIVGEENDAITLEAQMVERLAELGAQETHETDRAEDSDSSEAGQEATEEFATLTYPDGTDREYAARVAAGITAAIIRAVENTSDSNDEQ